MTILAFALGVFLLQQTVVLPDLPGGGGGLAVKLAFLCGLLLILSYRQGRVPLTTWAARFRAWGFFLLVIGAAVGTGWSYASFRASLREADALAESLQGVNLDIAGRIDSLPESDEFNAVSFIFRLDNPPNGVPHRVRLTWFNPQPQQRAKLHADSAWHFTVRLKRPHTNQNPHVYDYEGWLFANNIRANGYVYHTKSVAGNNFFLAPPRWSSVDNLREKVRANIEQALPAADYPYRGLLVALSVGDQNSIADQQWSLFSRTGVTHLMSISGLHITMVGGLVYALVAWLWRRYPLKRWPVQKVATAGGVLGALAYTVLAGFGIPAQRTLYMLVVLALSVFLGRSLANWRILAVALLVVLLYDPWAVLSIGFWLSFGAVALLLYIDMGAVRLRWRAVRAQWAMMVGLLPALLFIFQQFSLISPIANAIAIPVISFFISPLAILGGLVDWQWLLRLTHALLVPLMGFLQLLSHSPLAVWQQAEPPLWTIFLAVFAVIGVLAPPRLYGRAISLLAFLPMLMWTPPRPAIGDMRVTILDVGQGSAAHVQTHNHDLLFDAGPAYRNSLSDSGQRVLLPYFRGEGVAQLDLMLLSHADSDHIGGAMSVMAGMKVKAGMGTDPRVVALSPDDDVSVAVDSAMSEAVAVPWTPCLRGNTWEWDGVRFTVLHPTAEDLLRYAKKHNEVSCVVAITAQEGSLLLPGDIPSSVEGKLVEEMPAELSADILVLAHHGSKSSSSAEWLAAVAPAHAIISVGYRSQYGHPAAEVLARLGDSTVWRTDKQGAVIINITSGALQITTQRTRQRHYWHSPPT